MLVAVLSPARALKAGDSTSDSMSGHSCVSSLRVPSVTACSLSFLCRWAFGLKELSISPVLLLATLQVHPRRREAQAKPTKNLCQKLTVRKLGYILDLSIYRECVNLRQMLAF